MSERKYSLLYTALVYSNLWVGLSVGAFCYLTMSAFYHIDAGFVEFVVLATAFSYSYMRLAQHQTYNYDDVSPGKAFTVEHRWEAFGMTAFYGVLAIIVFLRIFEWEMVLWLIPPAIIAGLYPLSFKSAFHNFTSLRTVPGLKVFLIAFTWSYVTVLLPVLLYDYVDTEIFIEFIMRALLLFAMIIPFDIRDLEIDRNGMGTLPQILGLRKSRELAQSFIFLYQVWVCIRFFVFGAPFVLCLSLLIGMEIGYWLVRKIDKDKKESYYAIWIDGIPIYSMILLIIINQFL